jgi:hypothetical protein
MLWKGTSVVLLWSVSSQDDPTSDDEPWTIRKKTKAAAESGARRARVAGGGERTVMKPVRAQTVHVRTRSPMPTGTCRYSQHLVPTGTEVPYKVVYRYVRRRYVTEFFVNKHQKWRQPIYSST